MKKGFTLIELLIVIAIIGILTVMGFGNYLNSVKIAKDGRRKADLQTIQKALELYYQDNQAYPNSIPVNGSSFCNPGGCTKATYLQSTPMDPNKTAYVYTSPSTNTYKLYSCIENTSDSGPGVNQSGYAGTSCGTGPCSICKFGVSSSNTSP